MSTAAAVVSLANMGGTAPPVLVCGWPRVGAELVRAGLVELDARDGRAPRVTLTGPGWAEALRLGAACLRPRGRGWEPMACRLAAELPHGPGGAPGGVGWGA